jgi:hypothetical protein
MVYNPRGTENDGASNVELWDLAKTPSLQSEGENVEEWLRSVVENAIFEAREPLVEGGLAVGDIPITF